MRQGQLSQGDIADLVRLGNIEAHSLYKGLTSVMDADILFPSTWDGFTLGVVHMEPRRYYLARLEVAWVVRDSLYRSWCHEASKSHPSSRTARACPDCGHVLDDCEARYLRAYEEALACGSVSSLRRVKLREFREELTALSSSSRGRAIAVPKFDSAGIPVLRDSCALSRLRKSARPEHYRACFVAVSRRLSDDILEPTRA